MLPFSLLRIVEKENAMVLSVQMSNSECWKIPKMHTNSCLNAITRFTSRKDKPSTIINHNETNCVGEKPDFVDDVAAWNGEGMEVHLIQQVLRLKFKPPAAPHFGGVCE